MQENLSCVKVYFVIKLLLLSEHFSCQLFVFPQKDFDLLLLFSSLTITKPMT